MEKAVSEAILSSYFQKLNSCLDVDAAIIGGGPSGLVCATLLAKTGKKIALFERHLAPGGGMWGGAMLFNQIYVQEAAKRILDDFGISSERTDDSGYVVDAVEATSALIYQACRAGVKIFNGITTEDVIFLNGKVAGIVINYTTITKLNWHVDPLMVMAKTVLDATGHPAEICQILTRKNSVKLQTSTGGVVGEMSLSMEVGEKATVENTKEVYPGLYVSGMAANAANGNCRMGPIFGGMLLSGEKAATLMRQSLEA